MHRSARIPGQTAQSQIFERRAKSAAGMPLDVGKIDHEARILDQSGDLPLLDAFIRPLMLIEIFFIGTRGGIHGTADHLRSIPALFSALGIPVQIHHNGLAASILDGLYHAPYEHWMDGRVGHVVAGMHFDDNRLLVDPVAQVKLIKDQIEFGRQGLFGFEPRLARRTEEYFGWHGFISFRL